MSAHTFICRSQDARGGHTCRLQHSPPQSLTRSSLRVNKHAVTVKHDM